MPHCRTSAELEEALSFATKQLLIDDSPREFGQDPKHLIYGLRIRSQMAASRTKRNDVPCTESIEAASCATTYESGAAVFRKRLTT